MNSMCIICNEGATSSKRLIQNPEMLDELVHSSTERLSLGENNLKGLSDKLVSLSECERKRAFYHSECRKPIVNKSNIERLKSKRTQPDTPARGPGLPFNGADFSGEKDKNHPEGRGMPILFLQLLS